MSCPSVNRPGLGICTQIAELTTLSPSDVLQHEVWDAPRLFHWVARLGRWSGDDMVLCSNGKYLTYSRWRKELQHELQSVISQQIGMIPVLPDAGTPNTVSALFETNVLRGMPLANWVCSSVKIITWELLDFVLDDGSKTYTSKNYGWSVWKLS